MSGFVVLECVGGLFVIGWLIGIGAFDRQPRVVLGSYRARRIAQAETHLGYEKAGRNAPRA